MSASKACSTVILTDFPKRILTDRERDYCGDRIAEMAVRFAGKEAVMKCLGTGVRGVKWKEIEILANARGKPVVILHGGARDRAHEIGLERIEISLTHEKHMCLRVCGGTAKTENPIGRPTMKLLTSAEMRDLESRAEAAGVSTDTLMENAGLAVAQEIWMQLGSLEDRRIAVLVGPGNNGGDGLVAARHLFEWGAQVRVYALRVRSDSQWTQTVEMGVPCGTVAEDKKFEALEALLSGAEAIVDALLGTGSSRPIEGDLAEIMQRLAAIRSRTVKPKVGCR